MYVMMQHLCTPAALYICFTLIHIIIDIYMHLYSTAIVKFIIMIIFTIFLNILCKNGLGIISWIIVFVPFIFITIITTLILYIFQVSPEKNQIIMDEMNDHKEYIHHKVYNEHNEHNEYKEHKEYNKVKNLNVY